MNRIFFEYLSFTKSHTETWPCPTCETGRIALQKGTIVENEDAATRKWKLDEEFCHQDQTTHFSCRWSCNNKTCGEVVHVVGKTAWDIVGQEEQDGQWYPVEDVVYRPTYFLPTIPLFTIPKKIAPKVRDALLVGFALAFADANAAANQLRTAVECLLDELKIPKWPKASKPGQTVTGVKIKRSKRRPLSLHTRIEKLPMRYEAIKQPLLAVKWLGNDGSHATGIDRKNMLIGYEILEHCLLELHNDKRIEIQKAVKAINKRGGQIRPPTPRHLKRILRFKPKS